MEEEKRGGKGSEGKTGSGKMILFSLVYSCLNSHKR